MTINKSQGQTLQNVGVWLNDTCFAHGQLYVAMSRVRHQADWQQLWEYHKQCCLQRGLDQRYEISITYNVLIISVFQFDDPVLWQSGNLAIWQSGNLVMLQSQDIVLLQLFNLHMTSNKSSIVTLCFILDGGGLMAKYYLTIISYNGCKI